MGTTKTMWIECKLAWFMPFHLEHHAFPYVPFYLLPELHSVLVKELDGGSDAFYAKSGCKPDGQNGYLSVHRQILSDIGIRIRFMIDKSKYLAGTFDYEFI